jgi:glutamate---cysteine ligase / carboxylate-amine ligase
VTSAGLPDWALWQVDPDRPAWTVGIEEEVMLLAPRDWCLAHVMDELLPELSPGLAEKVSAETHACTLELETGVHATVAGAVAELGALRTSLAEELHPLGLAAAAAGTHPLAVGEDTEVSGSARYQVLEDGLRALARREPTFALHVHVGVPIAELAMAAADRLRTQLPLILALSANSPFWRGVDTGLASMRSALFQAFPRAGLPRRFGSYSRYVETIDALLRADAFPEPTFIWWDVRLQPRFATIEVRIMDAQSRLEDVAALTALIQTLVRLLATERLVPDELLDAQETLAENRFIASRDGMAAELIDPQRGTRVPAAELLADVVSSCRGHARDLECTEELAAVGALAEETGAVRQRAVAEAGSVPEVAGALAGVFLPEAAPAGVAPPVTGALQDSHPDPSP